MTRSTDLRPYDLSGLTRPGHRGRALSTGSALPAPGCLAGQALRSWSTATSERVHVRRDELRAEGLDVAWGVADLSEPAAVDALVADKGPFDVLVNNAGMT